MWFSGRVRYPLITVDTGQVRVQPICLAVACKLGGHSEMNSVIFGSHGPTFSTNEAPMRSVSR